MNEYKILDIILDEYDLDNETMIINQILLGEESPINIIDNKLNNNEINKSNETSKEINDLLNLDNINIDNNDKIEIDNDNKLIKVDVYPEDDFDEDEESIENINVTLKNIDNNMSDLLKVNIMKSDDEDENSDKKINLKINNDNNEDNDEEEDISNSDTSSTINVNINNNDINNDDTISVKLKNLDKEPTDVKLKVVDTSTAKETGAPGEILLKLKSYDEKLDDKTSEFIKKRDELLQSNNPNFQLSTCLKIIVQLKESLERLINHLPDEIVLTRTKYLLGSMLDQIMDNSTLLLKNKEKIKEIIYKIFSMIISINDYISNKYNELEDKLDSKDNKKKENTQIKKSIKKAEDKTIKDEKENNNYNNNNDFINSSNQNNSFENKSNKIPNINKKKI